ncbi:hypothetical protein J3B02_005702, partial [Coemansia erecta]
APISNSTHWSNEETKLLIKTWGEHRDEFAEIKRNLSVWNKVLERLLNAGFFRTVEQCRNRWKFLETKYRAAAKEIEAGGRNTWGEFYDEMHLAKNGPNGSMARRRPSCSSSNGSASAANGSSSSGIKQTPEPYSSSQTPPSANPTSSSMFVDTQGRVTLPPIRSTAAFGSSATATATATASASASASVSAPDLSQSNGAGSRIRSMSPPYHHHRYHERAAPVPYRQSYQRSPRRSSSARSGFPYHVHYRQHSSNYQVHPLAENHLPDSLLSSKTSSTSPTTAGSSAGAAAFVNNAADCMPISGHVGQQQHHGYQGHPRIYSESMAAGSQSPFPQPMAQVSASRGSLSPYSQQRQQNQQQLQHSVFPGHSGPVTSPSFSCSSSAAALPAQSQVSALRSGYNTTHYQCSSSIDNQ